MNTVAWVLILAGLLTLRQVSRGRTLQIGDDLSDALLALVRGDSAAFTEVLARSGAGNEPVAALGDAMGVATVGTAQAIGITAETVGKGIYKGLSGANLGLAAIVRGEKAKGYRWGATGPDYYDCSGLIWRAAQDAGYKGPRFTTATIRSRKEFKRVLAPGMQAPSQTPMPDARGGDIVLWPAGSGGITGHMGVITSNDRFYSARSVRSGIGESSISGFRKTKPIYLRYEP